MKISARNVEIVYGIVPVRFENDKPLFLILQNKSFYEFPKGHKDKNETDLEAAIRETYEESGLEPSSLTFPWGRDSKETDAYKKGRKAVRYFVALTTQKEIKLRFNPELGRAEHDNYLWATYDEAKDILGDRLKKILDWAMSKIK